MLIAWTLRLKLLLASLAVVLLTMVLLLLGSLSVLQGELRQQAELRIAQFGDLADASLGAPLAQRDHAALQQALDLMRGTESIRYLVLLDHRNQVLASAGWPAGQALPPVDGAPAAFDLQHNGQTLNLARDLQLAGQRLGSLRYGFSTDFIVEARHRMVWRNLPVALGVLLLTGLLLALVVAAATGGAAWLLRSQEGTVWLLSRVPGLQVQGLQGALLSDAFAAEKVVVRWGTKGQQSVTIDGLQARGLTWQWHPSHGAWVGLQAQHLQARRVDVQTGPPGPKPVKMPATLDLPLRLYASRVQTDELQIESLAPMRALDASDVRLWEPGGREYHAQAVAMDWERARIEGTVSLGAHPPFTLQAQARAQARGDGPAWTADARVNGPLARFDLTATLRGNFGAAAPPPARAASSPAPTPSPAAPPRPRTACSPASTTARTRRPSTASCRRRWWRS